MNKYFNRDRVRFGIKITMSIVISILIAKLLNVEFAASTGVVALLSMQSTKKDTLSTALRRVVSFVYTLGIAVFFDHFISNGPGGFFWTILLVVVISVIIGWESTLSVNAVLITHLFIGGEAFTTALLINETKRIFIGIGVALIMNLFFYRKRDNFAPIMKKIENCVREIFTAISAAVQSNTPNNTIDGMLVNLEKLLKDGDFIALSYAKDHIFGSSRYYAKYIQFRVSEYSSLNIINKYIKTAVPNSSSQSRDSISEFALLMAELVTTEAPIEDTEAGYKKAYDSIIHAPLPTDSQTFVSEASMLCIINELFSIVGSKHAFVDGISDKEKKKFWTKKKKK